MTFGKLEKLLEEKWHIPKPYLGYQIRDQFPDLRIRLHSLPEGKRIPETLQEMKTTLARHNATLQELNPGEEICVLTSQWSEKPNDTSKQQNADDPGSKLWQVIDETPGYEADPEFFVYRYVYVSQRKWTPGVIDDLLKEVADDKIGGLTIAPSDMRWLFCPYDGGADIFCESPAQRDYLLTKFKDWLPDEYAGMSEIQLHNELTASIDEYKRWVDMNWELRKSEDDDVYAIISLRQDVHDIVLHTTYLNANELQRLRAIDVQWQEWILSHSDPGFNYDLADRPPKYEWWWWIDHLDELNDSEKSAL